MDGGVRFISLKVAETFGIALESVEVAVGHHCTEINTFLSSESPKSLVWFYEDEVLPNDKQSPDNGGDFASAAANKKALFVADVTAGHRPTSKALLFLKPSSAVGTGSISCMEVLPSMFDSVLTAIVGHSSKKKALPTLFSSSATVNSATASTVALLLPPPDARFFSEEDSFDPGRVALAPQSPAAVHCSEVLENWCSVVEAAVQSFFGTTSSSVLPPSTARSIGGELEQLQHHASTLNQLFVESHQPAAAAVCQVTSAVAPMVVKRWNRAETRLGEAVVRVHESIDVLSHLEPFLEPLLLNSTTDTKDNILSSLPRAFQKLRAAATASQVYSSSAGLESLLRVLGDALTHSSRSSIAAGGKLWEQPKSVLVQKLSAVVAIHACFEAQCSALLKDLAAGTDATAPSHHLVLGSVTAAFTFVAKRCSQLWRLFSAAERFTMLTKQTHIPGVSAIAASFFKMVGGLQKMTVKESDILDASSCPNFERDLLDFEVHVNDLELALQDALRASFDAAVSTEHALCLLRQHAALLPADVVTSEVDAMYFAAFQRFAGDVEAVQEHYEKHKNEPPVPRGAPPVAGAIQWSRALLQRVERPMRQFASHEALISAKESKKTIKSYNRLAQTLLEFEGLMYAAWVKGADAEIALLHAPVLVQHPQTMQLHVNLESTVSRVLQEGQRLARLGLSPPERVRRALLAAPALKAHHAALTASVAALYGAEATLPQALRPLGMAMTRAVVTRAQPALSSVCWTSATLDGFIHAFTATVYRFCEVSKRVRDVHVQRIEAAVHDVASLEFLTLEAAVPASLPDFIALQDEKIAEQSGVLLRKNEGVQLACDEVLELISGELQHHGLHMDKKACEQYRQYCTGMMRETARKAAAHTIATLRSGFDCYNATTTAATASSSSGLLSFELHLDVPAVQAHPSLDEVKHALSGCASKVLAVVEKLPPSGNTSMNEGKEKEEDGSPESTASTLKELSAAVDGMRGTIELHIRAFQHPFSFLWLSDKNAVYAAFMDKTPTLEESEDQLRHLDALQTDLDALPSTWKLSHILALSTDPLKRAVRAEIAEWKTEFSHRLHLCAQKQLEELHTHLRGLATSLSRKIKDTEDVAAVMKALEQGREEESECERRAHALADLYSLLARHDVHVPTAEVQSLGDLANAQTSVKHAAAEAVSTLTASQTGFVAGVKALAATLAAESVLFRVAWEERGPSVPGLAPMEAASRLATFQAEFESQLKGKWEKLKEGEAMFGLPPTPLPGFEKTEEEIIALSQLYGLYTAVLEAVKQRGALLWAAAVASFDEMASQISQFQAASRTMPKTLRDWSAYKDCRRMIEDLVGLMPLLQGLAHAAVQHRHWKDVATITGTLSLPLPCDGLTLGHVLNANLLAHREELEELCAAVLKEDALERKLKSVAEQWAAETFTFTEHKSRGAVVLKPAETAELMERLEDSSMVLGGMAASRYAVPFRLDLQALSGKLGAVGEVMEHWLGVQSMWTYMEVVFTGGDIMKQLPEETKRFQAIDRSYIGMVVQARETGGRVLETCAGSDALRTLLPHLLEQLELCQKSLSAYLETKRSEFPRFYFVSDPTLLEILSLGSDPAAVVPHFQSGLFDSLANVTFDPTDKYKIIEMWSKEGERVLLRRPVDARGPVEVWLQRLVTEMQETMRYLIRETAYDVQEEDLNLAEFLFSQPAQVALLGLQLRWTGETQAALQAAARGEKGALTRALKRAEATLRELVALALRNDLTKLQRTALETCITVYIHQKEATEDLVRKRVRDPRDFEWLKQCRLTWREDRDTVIISICDVDLEYSYEYLGVKERLVITPLTDTCYVTLTQALGMNLGGAPAGPAGTGKTETTKDLGATLGKYVVVFNCSDQMDHKGMGKIFKGLAQSGLWGCFDEFNRINLDVLSVCAQQISSVLSAVRERRKTFTFTDGSTVPLDHRVGFFITMNPGYAGRQELPENLKALFRGVTMMVPNRQIIMKVKLAAAGFQENELLAKKFNVLYALCEQQLSKQPHYDFGLRNILSVLRTAGTSKRANPTMSETELIMRTLRDMNMSKFVAEDVPLFLALIDDLFPGQTAEKTPAADVAVTLEKVCKERGLQPHTTWINKCIQLYETSLVRHGIMVVGPAGSGKSSAVDCLAAALTELGQKTVVWRMNPKSITAAQMFGRMDAATGDWTDGVFATLWRRAARAPKGQSTWIVLDGPVDAVWIENLNTVLDDNKVLTLANGDRVLMTPHMRLIFEPENLNNASPATVSRAGIIYISATELGWEPMVESWLQRRAERETALLRPCFNKFVGPILEFVRVQCSPVMATEAVCQVDTLLTLLTGVLGQSTRSTLTLTTGDAATPFLQREENSSASASSPAHSSGSSGLSSSTASARSSISGASPPPRRASTHDIDPAAARHFERHFIFCVIWSLGGLLSACDRGKLDAYLRSLSEEMPYCKPTETVYEHYVDETSGEWGHWAAQVPTWTFPSSSSTSSSSGTAATASSSSSSNSTTTTTTSASRGPRFTQMIVPTLDSVRYEKLLTLVHTAGKASLLVGGSGTAKTTTLQQFLSRFDPDTHLSKTITFSSLTTPALFQSALESSVEKRQGRTYGPAGGKKSTFFLDDLSMPAVNQWGDQITNELTRQVLEQGGWYSTEKPVGELKQLVDVQFVAAMNLPGAGRSDIPNRLKRQFCIFHLPPPSEASIVGVFGQLVRGHFSAERCAAEVAAVAPSLVPATMHLWAAAQLRLLPTPTKLHYSFTLRDMSKVFQGIMLASTSAESTNKSGKTLKSSSESGSGSSLSEEEQLVSLWAHECRRVFSDKLISPDEKTWVDAAVLEAAVQHFGGTTVTAAVTAPIVFADFLRDAPIDEATGEPIGMRPSCYEAALGGLPQIRARIEALVAAARECSRPGESPPDLVLFDDALSHVLRVSRVLAMDRGSALLVGVGGSGKQSLARLAAFLAGATCFKITLTKSYSVANLLEDLKGLYKAAAFKPQPIAFLLTEADIKDEAFLEYINQILSTGEVAGLFPREELDALLNDIRPLMRATEPGVPDTWDNLYSFFINRVRDRLHVVLCFSPVGPKFAQWAQQFPGLINGCTVDWFLPWPQEALMSVSSKLLSANTDVAALPPAHLSALQQLMALVHTQVTAACLKYQLEYRRAAHVTPKSFISALETFHLLYSTKLAHLRSTMARLEAGLGKMNSAKDDVGRMRIELAQKDKDLVVAGVEAERLLAEISESAVAAEKERAKVGTIVEAVRSKAAEIAAVKADAERDLEAAQPALEAALSALNSITPKDIVGLKALRNPPDIVKRIFDCVLLLRHFPVTKVSWQDVKGSKVIVGTYDEAVRMMGDMNFLQALLNFPKEAINDETVELLQPYFAAPDFNFEAAKKASGNVAGLCNWAESMCRYHQVAKAVEPKIIALRAAEAELKIAEAERAAAEGELAVVQAALTAMQKNLEAAVAQKAALEADASATRRKMETAATLMGALGGEEKRWIEQGAALHAAEHRLVGDCAVACAFLSYLGPFNRIYREHLLTQVIHSCGDMGLPLTQDLDVSSFLVEATEAGQWAVEGLPTDPLSVQNGVFVTRASRWPLLVDPQGQGRAWLTKREAPNGLRVTQLTDGNFRAVLEDSLAGGKPLLIENVEESLDPALDPILEKKFVRKGRSVTVQLGDKEIEVAPGFKLFLTCRLPSPKFTPEIFAKVTVVDFTVTPSGLEDQLLGALVLREKRGLEEQRRRLVEDVASYQQRVAQLESDLLTRLSTSSGNLLDDSELVDVLAMTKATATEVAAKMATASETRRKITAACEEYRPAAGRAMLLYFIVSDLSGINCMYQTSLAQFTALYEESIDTSDRPPSPAARVTAIASHFTAALFDYIQRGLYERHKLVFALMIANKVAVSTGDVTAADFETFLKLGAGSDSGTPTKRKAPREWIPITVWRNVLLLAERLPAIFADLPDSVVKEDAAWAAWYDLESPEAVPPPKYGPSGLLSSFQKMCLVRAFREDRALVASGQFVSATLGPSFVEPSPTNVEKVWSRSLPKCPVVCLLSAGADPTKSIEDLAKRKKIKCFGVSMGQGQEVVARRLVAAAAVEGHWVLLQNAHLGLAYLFEVEQYVAKLTAPHEAFRLWITCEPDPGVPIGLLHVALKVTNEAPVGLRAGLRASYQWLTQDTLDAVARPEWRSLLFALCFLHSVVQERRKFGPIGWNVPYEFNSSDLAACVQALQNHVADIAAGRCTAPDWPTLRYMLSTIQYGGRITDDRDRELMDAYAEKYFHPAVLEQGYALFSSSSSSSSSSAAAAALSLNTNNQKEKKAVASSRGAKKQQQDSTSAAGMITASYCIPEGTDIEAFRSAIERLPAQDSPELFGLHSNADLTFRALQVAEAVAVIEGTMPKGGTTLGGISREENVDRVTEGLLRKLPELFKVEDTKEALKKLTGGGTAPLNIHLRQEIERLNKVVVVVADTLRMLRLAIAGSIAMSQQVLGALEAVHSGRPPPAWLKISWEAPTLGIWFQGLISRHEQLHTWLHSGRPKSFWLPGFFNPQGFLTAVKQEVTRRHAGDNWALDDVVMVSEVTRMVDPGAVREGPGEGVFVHGLFLEGCAWGAKEGGKLVDAEPKKLFSPLPVLHVTAVQVRDRKKSGFFEAPCYRVRRRTGANYIASFMLKTDEERMKWVLRGAALLCSID